MFVVVGLEGPDHPQLPQQQSWRYCTYEQIRREEATPRGSSAQILTVRTTSFTARIGKGKGGAERRRVDEYMSQSAVSELTHRANSGSPYGTSESTYCTSTSIQYLVHNHFAKKTTLY
jgi:hypothetical protein